MKRKNLEILRQHKFNVPKFDVVLWNDREKIIDVKIYYDGIIATNKDEFIINVKDKIIKAVTSASPIRFKTYFHILFFTPWS